jgi:putative ABC transport system permease protein
MFRNVLAASLRNLVRSRLYAAISIGGLAVAMVVAILTTLFVRDELTFDRFVPRYQSVYVLIARFDMLGLRGWSGAVPAEMAEPFKLDFPQAKTVARYGVESHAVTRGRIEINEKVAWVDPDFFALFPFKTPAGDLRSSMQRPDGAVLTRSMARRYFGVDTPIGQTLTVDRQTVFRVAAVIEDLPDNANFTTGVFLSGASPASRFSRNKADGLKPGNWNTFGRTYFRLDNPAEAAAIDRQLPAFIARRVYPAHAGSRLPFERGVSLHVIPDADLHLLKDINGPEIPPGDIDAIRGLGVTTGLIVLIAAINFVNLMTARASRRAVEVGVRKAAGADRGHLVLQFIGESVLYALAALVLALALAELVLPGLDALLQRRLMLNYWGDPAILAFAVGLALLLGVAAGIYPALILSSFRPREALKGVHATTAGSATLRRGLVGLQFAVLIGLLVSVLVIARQTHFAMTAAIGMNTDQVLRIRVGCVKDGEFKHRTFVERLAELPGVAAVACSSGFPLGVGDNNGELRTDDGRALNAGLAPIDFGFFELYGVKPLAGRLPSATFGDDERLDMLPVSAGYRFPANEVINVSMARALGYATPQAAIGKSFRALYARNPDRFDRVTVIGVVPDTPFDLTHGPPKPSLFPVLPRESNLVSVKIKADRIPETLTAIDRLWTVFGAPRPIRRQFTDAYLNTVYASALRQEALIGALGAVALFIGALGLFGLAAFVAERRTKEIGVRKAMGASTPDILALLLWSFTQPVLWANLVAWPVSWWVMDRWLRGFSARIDLSPWLFLAATAAALVVAAATILAHALRVASAKPVGALRCE